MSPEEIKKLAAAGLTMEQLAVVSEILEARGLPPERTTRQERNRRYYEGKRLKASELPSENDLERLKRLKASESPPLPPPPLASPSPPAPPRSAPQAHPHTREGDIAAANAAAIPLDLNIPAFAAAWGEWCDYRADLYRRDKSKVWTAVAAKNTLTACSRHGPEISAMAINAAIGNSWRSLVWDRLQVNPSNQNATHPRNNRPPVTRNVEPLPPNPRSLNSTAADYSERVAALQRSGAPDDGNSSF